MMTVSQTPPIALPQAIDQTMQRASSAPAPQEAPKVSYAIYYSPVVRIDPRTQQAVWEIRDPQSGRVVQQFPSEAQLKAYSVRG